MRKNSIHLKSIGYIFAVLGLLICATSASLAQSVLTDDAHTSSATKDQESNFGTNPTLTVSSTNSTYLKFKIAPTLPADIESSDIAKATLKLFVSNVSSPGTIDVVHVAGSWSEKTITTSNAPPSGDLVVSAVAVDASRKGQAGPLLLESFASNQDPSLDTVSTTVGAALRGRPSFETSIDCETGGHGVPPLQWY